MQAFLILIAVEAFIELSTQDCLNDGFPTDISANGTTTIPEGTVVLAPFLTFTCDGYITHVSVGYEVTDLTSNQTVYLQLRRRVEGVAYSLINEVMLPRGESVEGSRNILTDYELPTINRVTVRENDVVGFRTPENSSLKVLIDDSQETNRSLYVSKNYKLDNFSISMMRGTPQISIVVAPEVPQLNCINLPDDIPSKFNKSTPTNILSSVHIFYPDIVFRCNGVIKEMKGWYQVVNEFGVLNASIQFQIWHPVNDNETFYQLLSEVTIASALNDDLIVLRNLSLPFYSGSIIGISIVKTDNLESNFSVINVTGTPINGYYHFTEERLCGAYVRDGDIISTAIDPDVLLVHDVITDDVNITLPTCNQRSPDSKKVHIIVITSGCVGAIIAISGLFFACYCTRKQISKRHRSPYHTVRVSSLHYDKKLTDNDYCHYYSVEDTILDPQEYSVSNYEVIAENSGVPSCETPYKVPVSDFDQLCLRLSHVELPRDKIELGTEIGTGVFGMVYHGVCHHEDKSEQVAIKTLHQDTLEENKVKLLKEAAMVEQFLHKNIVRLYGVVLHGDPMMITLEYLPKGNLLNFLRTMRENEPIGQRIPKMLLGFARDVGSGMNYLSNKCFIHRDLAARNILLTEDNVCKVADFGLARDLDEDNYYVSQGGCIPVKWMPPEALLHRTYTTASDVWSYGILLYEMWSLGRKPYEDYDIAEVISVINSGYRLPPPPGCPRAIYNAMIQCWHPDYHNRPSFSALLRTISQPSYVLFHWFEEDKQTAGPECDVIGAPIEAGHNLYPDLQNVYK